MQEELSSSDRPGKPETKEEQHVRNHDGSGKPDGEERLHKVQEDCHLKNRDDSDKFNLATDDENIDFNISGIPDAAVKRSQNFNIHDLIQRIASHPQQEAVQNDLEQHQSFNAFSDESKVAIMDAGNTEICEIVNVEPKWQCKVCLKHCSTGVIYCTCGHLMTKDSAENRKYITAVLDTFSIPNFYIRKNRPHGHRYGKAPGCKDYFAANQLAKKCRKKKYDIIHDRYIRDKIFRKSMIEVGRSEQIIKEMDKLASEDHTYKANKEEIEFYRGNWWIHTNVAHFDSVPTRYEPEFKNALSTMQRLKRAEDKKNKKQGHKILPPRLLGTGMQAGGSLILSTRLKDGMTTDSTGQLVPWWFDIYLRKESQRAEEFRIFTVNKSVTADGSLLSPTGGVKGIYPAPDIHEHLTIHKWLRNNAYIFTLNFNNLEHNVNNCTNTTMHTDANIAQF